MTRPVGSEQKDKPFKCPKCYDLQQTLRNRLKTIKRLEAKISNLEAQNDQKSNNS